MLNTDLKILVKILADRLQTVLPRQICREQSCAVKGRIIQETLHLVNTIIEIFKDNAALIKLEQYKAFDMVDYDFLLAVLFAVEFEVKFRW